MTIRIRDTDPLQRLLVIEVAEFSFDQYPLRHRCLSWVRQQSQLISRLEVGIEGSRFFRRRGKACPKSAWSECYYPQKIIDSFYCQVDSKSMQSCATSQVAKLFYGHQGRLIHKWGHYLEIYDRHLSHYQKLGRPVRLLEIGVYHGGSLQLWRQYFGPEAVIFGSI